MFGLLFGDIKQFLIELAVIVGIVAIIITMIKYENGRPFLVAFLLLAWGGLGCYSGFTMYRYYNRVSQVRGHLEEYDPYKDFDFYHFNVTDFSLLEDEETNLMYYEKNYNTTLVFDGTDKNYTLLVNNSPCSVTMANKGRLYGETSKKFEDVDGQAINQIDLTINFTFYSSYIVLKVETTATVENVGLLYNYYDINGFELRIIENANNTIDFLSESI